MGGAEGGGGAAAGPHPAARGDLQRPEHGQAVRAGGRGRGRGQRGRREEDSEPTGDAGVTAALGLMHTPGVN